VLEPHRLTVFTGVIPTLVQREATFEVKSLCLRVATLQNSTAEVHVVDTYALYKI
jgi:BRCT domain type II-containing protein